MLDNLWLRCYPKGETEVFFIMGDLPLKYLTLIDQPNGRFEHESGVRMNKRQLDDVTDLHWHNYFEIEFVLSGTGSHMLNGKNYDLKPGMLYMLTPVDFHQVFPGDKLELCTIMFNDHTIEQDLLAKIWDIDFRRRVIDLTPQKAEKVTRLFELMLAELQDGTSYKKEYIQNLLECIFITVIRCIETPDESGLAKHPHSDTPIQQALTFLHSNFRKNPSLSEVAAVSQYTPNYFCEIFRKQTGKTYNKYLNDLKLNFAKQILCSSDLSVTEVCYASGFSSLSHFLRLFKSTYGISPQIMRANTQKE